MGRRGTGEARGRGAWGPGFGEDRACSCCAATPPAPPFCRGPRSMAPTLISDHGGPVHRAAVLCAGGERWGSWGRRPAALRHTHRACGSQDSGLQGAAPPLPLHPQAAAPARPARPARRSPVVCAAAAGETATGAGDLGAAVWRPLPPPPPPPPLLPAASARAYRRHACTAAHLLPRLILLTCPHASIPIGCRRGAHAAAGAAAGHHACGGAAARRQRQRGQG